ALQRADAADDEHGRNGHGVPARQGNAVLRSRAGHGYRGRPERFRCSQRPGTDPRERALEVHALLLGHGRRAGRAKIIYFFTMTNVKKPSAIVKSVGRVATPGSPILP